MVVAVSDMGAKVEEAMAARAETLEAKAQADTEEIERRRQRGCPDITQVDPLPGAGSDVEADPRPGQRRGRRTRDGLLSWCSSDGRVSAHRGCRRPLEDLLRTGARTEPVRTSTLGEEARRQPGALTE